jgi:hypothetical protein
MEPVTHNAEEKRFEVVLDGQTAELAYLREPHVIALVHTEVPEAFEGQGVGSRLARAALDYARDEGLRVMAVCPFVASYVERHPEYRPLLVRESR